MLALLVALRKESVDRNIFDLSLIYKEVLSLSARRAWIEILFRGCYTWIDGVALRKESVDRNYGDDLTFADGVVSLSARRAWIEIGAPTTQAGKHARRSPQGERG